MFEYEKLWKLLKSKNLKKVDLKKEVGITPTTLAKLNKNENVSMEVLNRLCEYLECDIGDIVEHKYTPYKTDETLGTFTPNKKEIIHNWFSYLEGYSKELVENELSKLNNITAILDPFGGSGTTPLVGVLNNIKSYYCETNPVMAYIAKIKTDIAFKMVSDSKKMEDFKNNIDEIINKLTMYHFDDSKDYNLQGFEKYFEKETIGYIVEYKRLVSNINNESVKSMFHIALAGIAVNVSKMVRRGDLRFAKGKEITKTSQNFLETITSKLNTIYEDLLHLPKIKSNAIYLTEDARDIVLDNIVDAVITSPPYLNGTNYIRNTKLELKLLDFIDNESDLASFHKKGIIAGINNVSVGGNYTPIVSIENIIDELNSVSYDSRIQKMISAYFNDMSDVFMSLKRAIRDEGYLILDIGDSQFAGVHIPTHQILVEIANSFGFRLYDDEIIRSRKSKNGFNLTQRILRFRLYKSEGDAYREEAERFLLDMDYQKKGRNWGHSLHSLCSYRGKLKPAIANELVERFTRVGDIVLDPMGGVGTIPLEACLQGRRGISNDLSELAYVVSKAKVTLPNIDEIMDCFYKLSIHINLHKKFFDNNQEVRNFGLNKSIIEYYHPETMKEILAARDYYANKQLSNGDCFVLSCLLHILHGNRPYALSRTSHPLTPYAPKGEFIYKNTINNLKAKILRSYKEADTYNIWEFGESFNYDISELPRAIKDKADVIITSPPFASSFKFYTQNWLRLWFVGWGNEEFSAAKNLFYDEKQNKDMDIYIDYFKTCSELLKENGKLILHVGKSDKIDMSKELIKRCKQWFDVVYFGEEDIIGENYGITDKGATKAHQFLFLRKK